MIAVTGSTGHLGRLVIAGLRDRLASDAIVALARDPAKAADLGVGVRQADYDRPETLDTALAGIDTLLLISANEVGRRAGQHRNVIDAAGRAGVGLIVYTSLLRADTSPIGLAEEHRATEAHLAACGIPHVLLRNGWYVENYAGAVAAGAASGAIYGAAGEGRISAAPRADYAAAAVAVLTGGDHAGRTYELGADTGFTLAELAEEVARQSGKPVRYVDIPEADYAKALEANGVPAPMAAAIASWDTAIAGGALFEDGHTLSRLIGRPTTPLAESVAAMLAPG